MSKHNKILIYSRLTILIAALLALGYIITNNMQTAGNIFMAVMGFSAVVFIHECGHFFVAKACDIKVEVFSIFIPPILFGIRRTEQGLKVRILPDMFPKDDDPDGDGHLSFTFGPQGKAGETEYRIGLIPIAGYVKMLGQEDTGADKQSQDPRSFGNKSTRARMAVIAAGVTFNVIAAVIIMMVVYSIGIPRMSAEIGGVIPGSPAAEAGLQTGDKIIEIDGKQDRLEYMDIIMAAALSNKDQQVPLKVERRDGSVENVVITAKKIDGLPVRLFGFFPPQDLTVAKVTDPEKLLKETSLRPGDRIISMDGKPIEHYWQFEKIIEETYAPSLSIVAERKQKNGQIEQITSEATLYLNAMKEVDTEADLDHVCSMVPCLTVINPMNQTDSLFQKNDLFLAIGDVNYPTYKEMRDLTTQHQDKELAITLLRTDPNGVAREIDLTVTPKLAPNSDRVIMGVSVVYDGRHPRIAKTITTKEGMAALAIPRGAIITAINDTRVMSFYDVMSALRTQAGTDVTVQWQQNQGKSGTATFRMNDPEEQITLQSIYANSIPFNSLKDIHKASGLYDALVMSGKKNVSFILQTYVTIKQLLSRSVQLKAMSGPVGIATIAYKAVEESFIEFLYLLAFISANLAVVNFLPIPVVDGGVFILLIVEKIQGRPLSLRMQEVVTYAGLTMILSLFVYLTYNDIVRLIFG
jgi:regulator of sigma E protease